MATKNSAKSVWEVLSNIETKEHVKVKGDAKYVSWTWAWTLVKQSFPDATFTKHTFVDNQQNVLPFMRDYKGNTFVQVSVTIKDQTITEIYPVMDNRMQAINAEKKNKFGKDKLDGQSRYPDATDVNNAFQRALTKVLAYHGMGINIYAGEDIPMEDIKFTKDVVKKGKSSQDQAHFESIDKALSACKDKEELIAVWKSENPIINKMDNKIVAELQENYKTYLNKLKAKAA
jgi:hypothetical protein